MSIIYSEGFNFYGGYPDAEQDMLLRRDIWNGTIAFIDEMNFQARNNGNAISLVSTAPSTFYRDMWVSSDYGIVGKTHLIGGIAFMKAEVGNTSTSGKPRIITIWQSPTGVNDQQSFFVELESVATDVTMRCFCNINPNPDIEITVPGVAVGVWHYLEWDIKLDDPGHFRIRLNGALQGDEALPVNSQTWRLLMLHPTKVQTHPNGLWLDDMILLDPADASQGPQFQDRLGPVQIRPVPLVGDASPSSWTASSGGAKYLDVDEQPGPHDKDATYISTDSAPQTQMFQVNPIDDSKPVLAVTAYQATKQPNPTVVTANMSFMADTEETPVGLPLQDAYRLFSTNYTVLPGGAPITTLGIAATDWGVRSQL